jgi:hypothetical protein
METEKDIKDEMMKQHLIKSGHTNRMDETRWSMEVPKWESLEKREHGWPRQGWRDDIKEAKEARDRAEEDCYRRED